MRLIDDLGEINFRAFAIGICNRDVSAACDLRVNEYTA
jgi:hypothetical protein